MKITLTLAKYSYMKVKFAKGKKADLLNELLDDSNHFSTIFENANNSCQYMVSTLKENRLRNRGFSQAYAKTISPAVKPDLEN